MANDAGQSRVATLWQWPMLLVSVGLMGGASYLFMGTIPKPKWSEQLKAARDLVSARQPEAAIDYLNRVLASRTLPDTDEAQAHLVLAQAIDAAQVKNGVSNPDNLAQIIQQSQLAMEKGIAPTPEIHDREARAYLGLRRTGDALEEYRKAAKLNPTPDTVRKVLDTELVLHDEEGLKRTLPRYLAMQITPEQRAWASLQQAQLLLAAREYEQARGVLAGAVDSSQDPALHGELEYRLGAVLMKLDKPDEAQPHLAKARSLLGIQSDLDAEPAVLLGQIQQLRHDYSGALALYQEVLTSHIDQPAAIFARLGRGVCRILLGDDDAGLADLDWTIRQMTTKKEAMQWQDESIRMLQTAEEQLANRSNFQGALEVMGYEQTLDELPPAGFFARMASLFERRADQLEVTAVPVGGKEARQEQIRNLRSRAGDSYIAYSRALTVADDKGYGEALWHGVRLYDRAGDVSRTISALELFVSERPEDPLAPDATLRLGKSYFSAGQFDKAIAAFQRNQLRYPKSLAASKSAIPLALAYIAKGPEAYPSAERVLLSVVDNNLLIAPEAEEFREAVFELGQLYYRTGRYEEAIVRLNEWAQRYRNEPRLGQVCFLMADSYRKSALLLKSSTTKPASDTTEATAARRERLTKAHDLYDFVVEFYRQNVARTDVEKLYSRLAFFYRADCLYDLGRYEEAIRAYDIAAFKHQDDPSALAAYVQIVNSYCALGRYDDARAANERARWMLKRMPSDAFSSISFILPRQYWEQWMQWSNESGLWKQETKP